MKKFNLRYSSVALSMAAMSALVATSNANAQEQNQDLEEQVVVGTRQVIQNSIADKRINTQISDGLTADEIGDIPALSIGEALETITGASAHRENGGATEVSIRGLGPFLTNTVINGREATNGAGNRAVNFSQFPSELFTKIGIFKTQSAEFIEGAVGGQIRLDTKRPVDHGKRDIQLSLKGTYNEDQQNVDTSISDDLGYRGTISYIDQFETDNSGTFGISVGVQRDDTSRPEGEYGTSTTFRNCALTPDGSAFAQTSGNCDGTQRDLTDPSIQDDPAAFVTSNRFFRQNEQSDERDAVFAAFQWVSPDERLNINLDGQFSEREQLELRHDLNFAETRRNITEVDIQDTIIQSFTNAGEIQTQTEELNRTEEYKAIALNVEYQVNEDLTVSGDISYSNTNRFETERDFRTGVNTADAGGDIVTTFSDLESSRTPTIVLGENVNNTAGNILDLNDPLAFDEGSRLRIRDQITERDNTITAIRGDFTLATDYGIINELKGGVRFSEQEYQTFGDIDTTIQGFSDQDAIDLANSECVNSNFPEDDFLDNISSGGLVTNGVSGEVFDSFVTYDLDCAIDFLLARNTDTTVNQDNNGDGIVDLSDTNAGVTAASADVTEQTFAAYLQAGYETELAGRAVRGNFGVRVVNTSVESIGFRNPLISNVDDTGAITFVADPNADFTETVGGGSYTEVLPSFTFVADLSETVLLRGGVFRGLSRPDPSALAFGRTFQLGDGSDIEAFEQAVNDVRATGNPDLEPLTSWNVDLAAEWYPNDDTILAVGAYYKKFQGGFEQQRVAETFEVDGVSVQGSTVTTVTSQESNNLYGIEVTASHAFTYLPGILSGFGGKLSYNYASSDFEFEDGLAGDGTVFNADGTTSPQFGIVDPAGLFGLSRNVASAQLYWGLGAFDAQLIYKYRSQYFQQFSRDTSARVRFVDDNDVLEFRASYKLNDNIKLSFEALNITDEPRTDFRGLDGNVGQILTFGPRYFLGIKAKL